MQAKGHYNLNHYPAVDHAQLGFTNKKKLLKTYGVLNKDLLKMTDSEDKNSQPDRQTVTT